MYAPRQHLGGCGHPRLTPPGGVGAVRPHRPPPPEESCPAAHWGLPQPATERPSRLEPAQPGQTVSRTDDRAQPRTGREVPRTLEEPKTCRFSRGCSLASDMEAYGRRERVHLLSYPGHGTAPCWPAHKSGVRLAPEPPAGSGDGARSVKFVKCIKLPLLLPKKSRPGRPDDALESEVHGLGRGIPCRPTQALAPHHPARSVAAQPGHRVAQANCSAKHHAGGCGEAVARQFTVGGVNRDHQVARLDKRLEISRQFVGCCHRCPFVPPPSRARPGYPTVSSRPSLSFHPGLSC